MRILNFTKRNFKELIREPLSLVFAIILPLFLLFIFQQFKIPNEAYELQNFTSGIIVFGFSFITMFTSMLVSKDKETSLLTRLRVSPMKSTDYIIGYILSLLPIIIIQIILFFILACALGLNFNINILLASLISIPISILFIAIGLLIGSLVTEKASTGISSIIVQLVCFTSGMYFSEDILGESFAKICKYLPFSHTVNIIKGIMNNITIKLSNIIIFIFYLLLFLILSVITFKRKMLKDK